MGLIYLLPIDDIRFLFHRRNYNPLFLLYSVLHLTSCTPTKSNFYFANSLAAVVNEPYPCSLLTFHVPNLMSLFRWLCRTKVSVQIRGSCKCFVTDYFFYSEALLGPRPTPKLVYHSLLAVRTCLFNIFTAAVHTGVCSSIHNLRTCHAVVTGTHLSWRIPGY